MRAPRGSSPTAVISCTGARNRASPSATLAGLPPTCSTGSRPTAWTTSMSASPMTANITEHCGAPTRLLGDREVRIGGQLGDVHLRLLQPAGVVPVHRLPPRELVEHPHAGQPAAVAGLAITAEW